MKFKIGDKVGFKYNPTHPYTGTIVGIGLPIDRIISDIKMDRVHGWAGSYLVAFSNGEKFNYDESELFEKIDPNTILKEIL